MLNTKETQRDILRAIARHAMLEKGLVPDFSAQALAELAHLDDQAVQINSSSRDLRQLPWCSIDNDDSRDLDQLTVAQPLPSAAVRILVAVADVAAVVRKESALDAHARQNTTSVYTAAQIFPMLPERLSTDLTSLNLDSDRLAVVADMVIGADGSLQSADIYAAVVRNHAKLAYKSVAAWLDGRGPMPQAIGAVDGLDANLRLQDSIAIKLKARRFDHGALGLETLQARAVFAGDTLTQIETERQDRAKDLIADFMIAANGVAARYLASKQFPCVRRVVRVPKRWDRIVQLAAEKQFSLPAEPDSKALQQFLASARTSDPLRFPDLSLSVIKLLGAGEYVVQLPGEMAAGHFGLAVQDYAHSTAPNRRYPDVTTQRLLKAAMAGSLLPFKAGELTELAKHCTEAEDAAKKIERRVAKSAAALLLQSRIGQEFDAIVTGAASKGTWVRLNQPLVEGKLQTGFEGVDVGQRIRVRLIRVDVQRGFIDFKKVD